MSHWLVILVVGAAGLLAIQVVWEGPDQSFAHHISTFWSRYRMLLFLMVCLFPLFVYDAVRLSHQFTGPIFALRVALRKLGEGQDIPKVFFRKGDFWQDLAQDVNLIAERLDQRSLTTVDGKDEAGSVREASGVG